MTPITERLAEKLKGWRQCAARSDVTVAERNAITVICDDVDCILRTHPAEGGEGRELTELADRMFSLSTWLHARGWEKEADMAEDAMSKFASLAERVAPPPQPVAPEEATIAYLRTLNVQDFARVVRAASVADPASLFAPERGEAKAVAPTVFVETSGLDCVLNAGATMLSAYKPANACIMSMPLIALYATPQPPPAPRFRDPTIEDAELVERVARAIAEDGIGTRWDHLRENYAFDIDRSDLRDYARAALNAIGAKVGEK